MNVTLRQLRAFVAVARSGSFTEAAVQLHVTQSALSGLIKELELALGVRVLHRNTRRVQLSEVGAEFLPLATRILQDLDQALGAITDIKALRTGLVRVSVPQLMACTLMPQVMSAFARKHPQVELLLADAESDAVLPKVRSGEVDLAVGAEREEVPDITTQLLFEIPYVAVMRAEHPLARRRRLTWDDLASQPLITTAGSFTRMLNASLAAAGQRGLQAKTEVVYMTTALSLVSAGLGITICQPYAQSLIRMHGLKRRPLHAPQATRRFFLFTRSDRKLSPAAHAFAEFLVREVGKLATA
jgi:DNA-binding transcriptional LysR family regulator